MTLWNKHFFMILKTFSTSFPLLLSLSSDQTLSSKLDKLPNTGVLGRSSISNFLAIPGVTDDLCVNLSCHSSPGGQEAEVYTAVVSIGSPDSPTPPPPHHRDDGSQFCAFFALLYSAAREASVCGES